MKKVLVLGGTSDALQFARILSDQAIPFLLSVATEAGATQEAGKSYEILWERLEAPRFLDCLARNTIGAVVDLTHPHAHQITAMASDLCQVAKVPYYRYNRPQADYALAFEKDIYWVDSEVAAAETAAALGTRILVTGSKSAPLYEQLLTQDAKKQVIYRVLPRAEILSDLEAIGVAWERVAAIKGPFSAFMNQALFNHFGIDVMIAKEAGEASGTRERIEGALACNIPIVMIKRPKALDMAYETFEPILEALKAAFLIEKANNIRE